MKRLKAELCGLWMMRNTYTWLVFMIFYLVQSVRIGMVLSEMAGAVFAVITGVAIFFLSYIIASHAMYKAITRERETVEKMQ